MAIYFFNAGVELSRVKFFGCGIFQGWNFWDGTFGGRIFEGEIFITPSNIILELKSIASKDTLKRIAYTNLFFCYSQGNLTLKKAL